MANVTTTELRDVMYMLIKNSVCPNVYLDELPSSKGLNSELVMLDFGSSLVDLKAYQTGTIRVWLCTKDSDKGALMGGLESRLLSAISTHNSSAIGKRIGLGTRATWYSRIKENSLRVCIKEIRITLKENNINN